MTTTGTMGTVRLRPRRALSRLSTMLSILCLLSCGLNVDLPREGSIADGSQKQGTKTETASVQPKTKPLPQFFASGSMYYRKWTKYWTDDDDIKYFYDEGAIIQSSKSTIQMWIRREFPSGAAQKEIVTLDEIDCSQARYRIRELRVTYPNGTTRRTDKVTKWITIYENSNEEYLMGEYCK